MSCSILEGVQSLLENEEREAGSQLGGWDDNVPGEVGDLHHDWPHNMLEKRITNMVEEEFKRREDDLFQHQFNCREDYVVKQVLH